METILDNDGNKHLFAMCQTFNEFRQHSSFTVNAWMYTRERDSYDAGFHAGCMKDKGYRSPEQWCANFRAQTFKRNIKYRIRVWPKGTKHEKA